MPHDDLGEVFGKLSDREILILLFREVQSLSGLKRDVERLKGWRSKELGALAVLAAFGEYIFHRIIGR